MARIALLLGCLLFALPASATPISADISTRKIELHAAFSGTDLLLFGARGDAGDILAVVRGPTHRIVVRKKEKIAGMWMVLRKAKYNAMPEFMAIASTKPLDQLGASHLLEGLALTPKEAIRHARENPNNPEAFDEAALRIKQKHRLFQATPSPITFFGETLFKTRIAFPDTLPRGRYTAEVYLLKDGQIRAVQIIPFDAVKTGFEAWLFDVAHHQPVLYGLLSLALAFSGGWFAYRLFRKR